MMGNVEQKNYEYGHFPHIGKLSVLPTPETPNWQSLYRMNYHSYNLKILL